MKDSRLKNLTKLMFSKIFILSLISAGTTIFLISAFFIYFYSNEYKISLTPGEQININDNVLKLNDFKITRNPDGSEKEFISELIINGSLYNIKVNYPIRIDKGLLYQWSYTRNWKINLYFPENDFTYKGPDNSILNTGSYFIKLGPFIPDFSIYGNKIITKSEEPLNPAILIEYYRNNILVGKHWVFYKNPVLPEPEDFEMTCIMTGFEENFSSTLNYIESTADYAFLTGIFFIFTGSCLLAIKNFYLLDSAIKE